MAGQQSITNINAIAVARGVSSPTNTEVLWLKPSPNPQAYEDLQIYDGTNWILVSRTPAQLLSDLKTVDGIGSGLDSDTLQGYTPAQLMAGQSIPALSVGELLVGQSDTVGAAKTVSGVVTVSATGAFVYVANSISHTGLTDIGTNTHAQIDSHISDSAIHVSTAQATKLSNITITQAVDLDQMEIDVTANNAKAGITPSQASEITANTAKVSNVTTNLSEGTSTTTTVDVNSSDGTNATLASASTTRAGLMSKAKFDEVVVNNAKVGLTSGQITILNNTSGTNTGDQDISGIATNASNIATNVTAIALNTAKVTNATHTGEVTGSGALTIADDIVDEANLKVSNAPTNGYVLTAQSGNTGGLTWAEAAGGDNLATADLTQTDLNRIYTRSAISGVSRLRFQGSSHILTLEDSSTIVMYSSKYDTGGTATPTTALSGSKLEFNGGTCRIQGAGSELRLHGYYNTTIESKINLSADLEITSKSTRKTIMNANILRWESSDSVTHYGNINNGKFIWATGTGFLPPTAIGSEGVSLQKDTLVKGSDNSVNTNGFKVTDINDNSLLEVKNNGRFATNGSNVNSAFNVAYDGTSANGFTVSTLNAIQHALNAQSYTIRNTSGTQDLLKFNVQSAVSKFILTTTSNTEFFRISNDANCFLDANFTLGQSTPVTGARFLIRNYGTNVSQQSFFGNITMNTAGRVGSSGSFGTTQKGFECFDTDKNKKFFWNGSAWEKIKGNIESVSVASATTVTPNIDISEMEIVSALASALTIAVPTGVASSFFEGKELTFRIKDDGTARALTWNAIFADYTGALPTTTVAGKTVYIGCKYNVVDTKWDVVAVQVQP